MQSASDGALVVDDHDDEIQYRGLSTCDEGLRIDWLISELIVGIGKCLKTFDLNHAKQAGKLQDCEQEPYPLSRFESHCGMSFTKTTRTVG